MQSSVNSKLLEGQVRDVIQSAKQKIQELKRDIAVLEKERKESFSEYKESEDKKNMLMIEN